MQELIGDAVRIREDDPNAFELVGDSLAPIRRVSDESVVDVATRDLCADVERVTERRPKLEFGLPEAGTEGDEATETTETAGDAESTGTADAVVIGTYGTTPRLDRFVDERIDDHELDAHPERYALAVLEDADPLGLERALVIVGSDPRGTAYGVYELSKRIGVSPWYWWADVPTERRERLFLSPGIDLEGPPSVRYRGVFLNDEDFGLRPWATETFEPESPAGIGPKTYEKLFELLLRLKGNTIWPAMHGGGKAFYQVEGNREVADRYKILVGTSHCEPMHRNNVEEWDSEEHGEWDYTTNAETIREYWAERLEEVADTENVFTIGMRGIHDSGMPGGETLEETTALLQSVLDDQRELLAEVVDPAVEEIPQVFCPYKEVLDIYRNGLEVPEDVCLVWPNDNFGYVRRLPTAEERERSGGHGIYYHLSYWGRPHDHQWLCSTPPALIREELCRAYDYGARKLWIANVGDLKPAEKETEYFFDLAWDVEAVGDEPVHDWLERWASREFDSEHATAIADVVAEYHRLGMARKPEHLGWNSVYQNTAQGEPQFSAVTEGDEARRRLEAYEEIERTATNIAESLPDTQRTAFFHLVLYPTRCALLANRRTLEAMRSRLYAGQGRLSSNAYADRALEAHDRIRVETERYNGSTDGKWRGMMSDHPRDLPAFDAPPVGRLEADRTDGGTPSLGVAVEGDAGVAGTMSGVTGISDGEDGFELPELVEGVDRPRFVDVFCRGGTPLEWAAKTDEEWLTVSERGGVLEAGDGNGTGNGNPVDGESERRLWVSVDWDVAPDSPTAGELRLEAGGRTVVVDVPIRPREAGADGAGSSETFLAVDGHVAIEAEDVASVDDGDETSGLTWEPVDGLSRTTDTAMAVRPVDGPRLETETQAEMEGTGTDRNTDAIDARAPALTYEFDWTRDGEAILEVQLRPTHAPDDDPLRYAVAVDGEAPTVVSFGASGGEHDPAWQRNVLQGTAISTTVHDLEPGRHTLSVYGVDPGVVLDRLVVRAEEIRRSYLGSRETGVGGRSR